MTTLKTQIDYIKKVDGFKIAVLDECSDPADLSAHGVLRYSWQKKMPFKNTVLDWRCRRFNSNRVDYDCRVLLGNGKIAKDSMTLEEVRGSYV